MDRPRENRPGMHAARAGISVLALLLAGQSWPVPARDTAPTYLAEVVNPELTTSLVVPRSNVRLLAGTDGTILRSSDGVHWSHARTPTAADLAKLAANAVGSTLLAVGTRGTLLRSVDAGSSWQAARNPVVDTNLEAVVFHEPS